jgi:tetratricopeptide (TPR) repeat protein
LNTSAVAARDGLLQRAQELRLGARLPEALAVLAQLEQEQPRFSRLHEERGKCLVAMQAIAGAIGAFVCAVTLNPTLPESWHLLAQLYRHLGNADAAADAAQRVALLEQLPQAVVAASALHADGDFEAAAAMLRQYLQQDVANVGARRLLARICLDAGALEEAERLLQSVLARAPDFHAARLDYAMALLQQQKHLQAKRQAEHLLSVDPAQREYRKLLGAVCIGLGDYAPVVDLYAQLLAEIPHRGFEAADLRLWRGNALKTLGRTPEAIEDYQAAIAAFPEGGVAWFSLANLKVYRFAPEEIATMRSAESRPGTLSVDRCYLCFALGKALEDAGDYAAAWAYYERGNAVQRAASRYRHEDTAARAQQQRVAASFFASRKGWGVHEDSPIFIVGMPRSGSTLVEQILASHSAIEGTQELVELGRCAVPFADLSSLSAAAARRLGQQYLDETRVYRTLGRPYFIDKMPNNFLHIGLIQLILPHAKIIDVRREPMACCVGNWKQLYGTDKQGFAYAVQDLAGYYRTYLAMMRHWEHVLPGRVLRVSYEDLVEDLEGTVRRLLGFCGLPVEPACFQFYATRRSVRTASAEQVRRPLSRDGLHQWQHFAPWLAPLQAALGDALVTYRD